MKQQTSNLRSIREQQRRQQRKKYLQQKFKQARKQLQFNNQKADRETFLSLLSKANENNYQEYKLLFRIYSYSHGNSYFLVGISGIIYDYLLQNPEDYDSIQILKCVLQYQQAELPQTQQFGKLLIYWMEKYFSLSQNQPNKLSKQYLLNSSIESIDLLLCNQFNNIAHYRYQEILRDILIEFNLLQNLQKIIKEQINLKNVTQNQLNQYQNNIILMVVDILCNICSSLPLLPIHLLKLVYQQINLILQFQQTKWSIGFLFTQINSKFKQNREIAQILFKSCQKLIEKEYFCIPQDSINLFIYCSRSGYPFHKRYHKLILKSIQENPYMCIRKRALYCLLISISKSESNPQQICNYHFQILNNETFYQRIINIFNSNPQLQQDCIDIIYAMIKISNQNVLQYQFLQHQQFISFIHQCLISLKRKLILQGLKILELLIYQQKNKDKTMINQINCCKIIECQFKKLIENLIDGKDQQISQLSEIIVQFIDNNL